MLLSELADYSLQGLRYFSVVASKGSVADAAKLLNVSQPAVTLQIQNLEKHLGFSLFERSGRRNVLTARGTNLFVKMLPQLEKLNVILIDAKYEEQTLRPRLYIGTVQGVGEYWLSSMLADFSKIQKDYRIFLEFEETAVLDDRLLTGQVSLVVSPKKVEEEVVVSEPLMEERLIPIGHQAVIDRLDKALKDRSKNPRFWESFDWIGYGTSTNSDPWAQRWLEGAGVFLDRRFRFTHVINSFEVIKKMLVSGHGVAVVPEHTCETELKSGALVSLETKKYPALKNILYLCYRQDSLTNPQIEFKDWLLARVRG